MTNDEALSIVAEKLENADDMLLKLKELTGFTVFKVKEKCYIGFYIDNYKKFFSIDDELYNLFSKWLEKKE